MVSQNAYQISINPPNPVASPEDKCIDQDNLLVLLIPKHTFLYQ